MADEHRADPSAGAPELLGAARGLRDIGHQMGEHPERVHPIIRDLDSALLAVSFFLHDASKALRDEAPTAVAVVRDHTQAPARAMYVAAMLESASNALEHTRHALMSATAESGELLWPEHDPVAAEEIKRYRHVFEQRAADLTPDADIVEQGGPPSAPPPAR